MNQNKKKLFRPQIIYWLLLIFKEKIFILRSILMLKIFTTIFPTIPDIIHITWRHFNRKESNFKKLFRIVTISTKNNIINLHFIVIVWICFHFHQELTIAQYNRSHIPVVAQETISIILNGSFFENKFSWNVLKHVVKPLYQKIYIVTDRFSTKKKPFEIITQFKIITFKKASRNIEFDLDNNSFRSSQSTSSKNHKKISHWFNYIQDYIELNGPINVRIEFECLIMTKNPILSYNLNFRF